jgi:hypothetical protein
VALTQALRLRTRFHRILATASFLFLLIQVLGGAVFDVTAGVYYWFFAGLTFLGMRLDQQAVAAPRKTAAAAAVLPAAAGSSA